MGCASAFVCRLFGVWHPDTASAMQRCIASITEVQCTIHNQAGCLWQGGVLKAVRSLLARQLCAHACEGLLPLHQVQLCGACCATLVAGMTRWPFVLFIAWSLLRAFPVTRSLSAYHFTA